MPSIGPVPTALGMPSDLARPARGGPNLERLLSLWILIFVRARSWRLLELTNASTQHWSGSAKLSHTRVRLGRDLSGWIFSAMRRYAFRASAGSRYLR